MAPQCPRRLSLTLSQIDFSIFPDLPLSRKMPLPPPPPDWKKKNLGPHVSPAPSAQRLPWLHSALCRIQKPHGGWRPRAPTEPASRNTPQPRRSASCVPSSPPPPRPPHPATHTPVFLSSFHSAHGLQASRPSVRTVPFQQPSPDDRRVPSSHCSELRPSPPGAVSPQCPQRWVGVQSASGS